MKYYVSLALSVAGLALIQPAQARDPQPPPSGVVIHLFGQNSVLSNVMPTTASPGGPIAAPAASLAPGQTAAAPQVEPTLGDIAHQMFITGDPEDPSRPAPGRTADRPAN